MYSKLQINSFLDGEAQSLYGYDMSRDAHWKSLVINPKELDYKQLSQDIHPEKFGRYTLNPEMQKINCARREIFIPNVSLFNNRPLYVVMKYLVTRYGATHHFPGIEYWYLGSDHCEYDLSKFYDFYFPGSVLLDYDGHWCLPSLNKPTPGWVKRELHRLSSKIIGEETKFVLLPREEKKWHIKKW